VARRDDTPDYDALADLFLDAPATPSARSRRANSVSEPNSGHAVGLPELPDEPPEAPVAKALSLEGLILGHLPVLGAAWVTQYAKHLAESSRTPVALLRLQAGQLSLDLVMPRGSTPRTSSRIGADAGSDELPRAVAAAAAQAHHWLIRVDETLEPEMTALEGLHAITMLTGADDAAVVASYRALKSLGQTLADRADAPAVRLAIMGADDERASVAEEKLSRASAMFLGGPIEVVARIGKVSACSTQTLYRAPATASLADIISVVRSATCRSSPAATAEVTTETTATPDAAAPRITVSEAPARVAGHPAAAPTTSSDPHAAEPDWTSLLHLARLSSTCPYAPGVSLAADDRGGLHLIAAGGRDNCPHTVQAAVQSLLTAAAWAESHANLLESANAGAVKQIRDHGPTLHLISRDGRSCRPVLDTGLRVHLAQSIETSEGLRWALSELN